MRINWVDNLRGIGILLIVLFLKNKFIRLIIPFILFNIIFFIILKLLGKFEGTRIIDFAVGLFYGDYLGDNGGYMNNTGGFNLVNVSTWFLPALFLTSIYYFLINKFIKYKYIKISFLIIISIFTFIESKYTIFRLPWSAEIALMMTVFYGFANIFKDNLFKLVEKINYKYLLLLVPIIGIHLFLLNSVNISTNYYGKNYFLFIINSLLGFFTVLILAKNIGKNKILDFLGKNSIIILGFEWLKVEIMENIDFLSFGLIHYKRGYIEGFTQFILTVILLIPIILIINKYLPFIIGGWYKNKINK